MYLFDYATFNKMIQEAAANGIARESLITSLKMAYGAGALVGLETPNYRKGTLVKIGLCHDIINSDNDLTGTYEVITGNLACHPDKKIICHLTTKRTLMVTDEVIQYLLVRGLEFKKLRLSKCTAQFSNLGESAKEMECLEFVE